MRLKWIMLPVFVCLFAVPALAQDRTHHIVKHNDSLISLSRQYNVCLEDLMSANPAPASIDVYLPLVVDQVTIPATPPCYEIVQITSNNPGASLPALSREQNVCLEELYNNLEYIPENQFKVYVPVNALPCFNEQGQRLSYFDENGMKRDKPVYVDTKVITMSGDVQNSDYCAGDLWRANPQIMYTGYNDGMELFLPDTVRHCKPVTADNSTLYSLSKRYNICMEVIQSANFYFNSRDAYGGITVQIPTDAPACYDEAGNRLNHDDKAVYRPQAGESLFDVAQRYEVCLQDLKDANPVIHTGIPYLPEVLFIPNTPKCDHRSPVNHTVEKGDTLQSLSVEYNVCFNRITQANADLLSLPFEDEQHTTTVDQLKIGMTLKIPVDRPDCYTLAWDAPLEMVDYVCYNESVDLSGDYTGHEPPISPIIGTDSGFCHERSNTTPVIYDNEKLTIYKLRPLDTAVTVSQCFGIDAETLLRENARMYPVEVRPNGSWIIPEPYDHDCYLLTADDATYYARETSLGYKAGYVDENGVYTVNYQDTLSSIGHEFGYLPSWIAAVNDLPDPNVIYYRQELKMPPYPSLHVVGKAAAIGAVPVMLGLAGYGVIRWRRGGKRKRKNEAA